MDEERQEGKKKTQLVGREDKSNSSRESEDSNKNKNLSREGEDKSNSSGKMNIRNLSRE